MKTARRIAVGKAVAGIAGLVTLVLGIATGNVPVVFGAAAVLAGAGILAAVADLRETEARCEAARQQQMEAAIEREREPEFGIEERMAALQGFYARLDGGAESRPVRFRERLEAEPEPGCHRA